MASFRKPSTRSRAGLAASTAIPATVTADMLDHAGEQAAMLAADAPGSEVPTAIVAEAPLMLEPPPETPASLLDEAVHHTIEAAEASIEHPYEPVPDTVPVVENIAAASLAQTEAAGAEAAGAEVAHQAVAAAEPVVEQVGSAAGRIVEDAQARAAPATSALTQIQARMADALQSSFEDALSYWTALMGVRSMPEAVSLNAQHLHRQVEAFTLQSRDFAVLVQKAAADVMDPFRRLPAS